METITKEQALVLWEGICLLLNQLDIDYTACYSKREQIKQKIEEAEKLKDILFEAMK